MIKPSEENSTAIEENFINEQEKFFEENSSACEDSFISDSEETFSDDSDYNDHEEKVKNVDFE